MSEVFGYVKPPLEELRDPLPGMDGFDFGTSPHGLSADLPLTVQKTCGASSLSLSAKQVFLGVAGTVQETREALSGKPPASHKKPSVYTSAKARSACRCIREAVTRQPKDVHYLRLTEREFLHAYHAVEHDRSRTRKAIGKGLAEPGDLRATDSLWQALQDVMTQRLKKAWRL